MPTLTFAHSEFANGLVRVEHDVNDANWRVSKVRCINDSDYPAVAHIYKAGTLVFTAVAPANITTSWNVTGVQLGWQEPYWNDITETWEEAGIEMGDYVMQVAWPWSEA